MPTFEYEFFSLYAPEGWADVTESLEIENSPITLALPDGVGALQLSISRYVQGEKPTPSLDVLVDMLREFATSNGFGAPANVSTQSGKISIAAGSFSADGDFVRAWYLSDGLDFAMATYVCEIGSEFSELETCEQIVSSLEFAPRT